MALLEFENYPSTDTAINATNLNNNFNELNTLISNIYNQIFPIGRGFIDFTDTDYSNYLGFTWERELVGLSPIGYNPDDEDFDVIGKTMGEKKHTLTVDELPEFKPTALVDTQTGNVTGSSIVYHAVTDGIWYNADMFQTIGGNQPHNIIQPSKVVAYWKRIA